MHISALNRLGFSTFLLTSLVLTLRAGAQSALTNGSPAQGTLAGPTDTKAWAFSAGAGEHISLTVTKISGGASFNPRVEVFSPTGHTLGAAAGTQGARLDLQGDVAGTYEAIISDSQQTGSGTYQLQIAEIPEAFTVPAGDEGGGLTNGPSHAGTISAGDVDLWTLQAHSGDRITLQLSKTAGGAGFTPLLEVFGPDGTRLGLDDGNIASRVDVQGAADGTYTVQVSALTPDGTGSYQLQLVQAPGALTIPSGDEGGPLPDGTDQSGTISIGDLDPWTFSAAAGDRITLQLTKNTGGAGFTPQLELLGPNGERRSFSAGSSGATVDVAIESAGTYVALVSDAGKSGAGTYTLHLARNAFAALSNPLVNGDTVLKALGGVGQTNSWSFLASTGDRIVLRVGKSGTTGTFNPWMRLYNPNNVLLGSQSTASAAEIALTATNIGIYTVLVSDGSVAHNQTGSYLITLAKPGTPVTTAPGDEGGALTNGLGTTGTIDQGDMDLWTFRANAGESVVVRMGELVSGSTLQPYLRIYGPDGVLQDSYGVGGTAAEVAIRATNSGTYTIIASDNTSFFTGTGGYRIKLVKTGSPLVIDPNDEGGALTNATTQTGNITTGDLDGWNFTAQAGQSIVLRMGELVANSTLTPYLRLFDPSGALLAQYGSSGVAAEVAVRATNSGTFSVVASDITSFYTGTGTYQIKLAKTGSPIVLGPSDSGGVLTNGFMNSGDVTIGGIELWNFDALAGDSIVVRMGKLIPNATLTPYLRIFGPEGSLLSAYGASSVAAEVSTRATNSGTFTVMAADVTSFYTGKGTYRIKLGKTGSPIVVAPNDEGGPLTNGWDHVGNIDAGDLDVWSFDAVTNESFVIRMGESVANSSLTPFLRVYGPDGALMSQYGASSAAAEVSGRATNSGTFTVLATDLSSFYVGSGGYHLKLAKTGRPLTVQTNDAGGPMTGLTNYSGALGVGGLAVYNFTACGGDVISLGVSELVSGSTLTPWLRLYDWSGNLLKSVSGAGNASFVVTSPGAGTYTVVVADLSSFYTGSGGFNLSVNGLSTGLKICPAGADANNSYVTIAGADPSNGFILLTSTNVDTPQAQWERIPGTQFDIFDNLNYTNSLAVPGVARRFFRWFSQ